MYDFFEGTVEEKQPESTVISAGGVGYALSCSMHTIAQLPAIGGKARVYARLIVRETVMELFGFFTKQERNMFDKLIGVSGVGPRSALSLLSSLTVQQLSLALVTGDAKALKAPGIGPKTVQRILIDLKGKISEDELVSMQVPAATLGAIESSAHREALEALIALGYSSAEASYALSAVDGEHTANDLIMLALRNMDQGKAE